MLSPVFSGELVLLGEAGWSSRYAVMSGRRVVFLRWSRLDGLDLGCESYGEGAPRSGCQWYRVFAIGLANFVSPMRVRRGGFRHSLRMGAADGGRVLGRRFEGCRMGGCG